MQEQKRSGVMTAVGNTPLIELTSLSMLTGCRIMAKCEFLNPGGSIKDRAALWMVNFPVPNLFNNRSYIFFFLVSRWKKLKEKTYCCLVEQFSKGQGEIQE